jgi:hypothetical protein
MAVADTGVSSEETTSTSISTSTQSGTIVAKPAPSKVMAYVKPNFVVKVNNKIKKFRDANGQVVYPLFYNGSTYLPVRAISALMEEDIEWDNYSRTVFIGKTLSNPNKSKSKKGANSEGAAEDVDKSEPINPTDKPITVTVAIRPDITIMYDFEIQNFANANKQSVYAMIYNGSAYLPIRAISLLMGEPIEWDNATKTILIGDQDEEKSEVVTTSAITTKLEAKYDEAVDLYDQATDQILNIQAATGEEELALIATSVSADSYEAQKQITKLKSFDTSEYTEAQQEAYEALLAFAQTSEYYILVLENIAYMAASGNDYSVLAETFLNFALESQAKLDAARELIEAL